MKVLIKIKNQLLKKALSTIYKITYEYKAVELNSFFIEVKKDSLLILARNNVIFIQRKIKVSEDVTIEGEGKFIINAYVFNELIQKTDGEIVLELIEKSVLLIKTKNYKTKINTIDLSFWRNKDLNLQGAKWTLTREEVRLLINQISYATQNKEGRLIFQGINFRSVDGRIMASATDGSRIARRLFSSIDQDVNLVLPLSALIEVNRTMTLDKIEKTQVVFGEKAVLFELGDNAKIYSKIIEIGDFPDTEKQFIQNFESTIVCQVNQLVSAIEKASIFFEQSLFPVISLRIEKNELLISSLEKNTLGFFEEKINSAKVTGKDQAINLQAKFILITLKSLETQNALIKISSSHGPVFFGEETNDDLKTLILPFWVY